MHVPDKTSHTVNIQFFFQFDIALEGINGLLIFYTMLTYLVFVCT